MINLVERYIEKAEDFREYLNEAEVYNKDITLSQAEWMLKKAAEEKQTNPMWDYFFKDDLKIKIPVNFEMPITDICNENIKLERNGTKVVDLYDEACSKVFKTLKDLITNVTKEMGDNLYDIPNYYEDFKCFDNRDIDTATSVLLQFINSINKITLNYHLPELEKAYRQGADIVTFSYHLTHSMYASHYYPVYYTREELKTMMLMLLENLNVLYNTTGPVNYEDKVMFLCRIRNKFRSTYHENLYKFFRENSTFCKRIAEFPKEIKPARCVRKLMDKLKVEPELYDNFEAAQTYLSLLKQHTNLEGTLVLSIDPIDFISASDNTYNWKSCFSVKRHGGYSRGCYTALTAPDICIAYIEGSTPLMFGKELDRKCSNKKWRAWVSINEDYFFVNKNYPFKSEVLTSFIESRIFSLTPQIWLEAKRFRVEPDVELPAMYSDVSDNTHVYFNSESMDNLPTYKNFIGETTRKLSIQLGGKTFDPFLYEEFDYEYSDSDGNMWGAPETYGMGVCASCGNYFSLDELYEDSYGDLYCDECRTEYLDDDEEEEYEYDDE